MLYQLTNGRTVYMTIEEFLGLTHEEEQYLISINYGEVVNNPFFGQFSGKRSRDEEEDEDIESIENSNLYDFLELPDENLEI